MHYVKLLLAPGKQSGLLGQIFTKRQNRIAAPAHLASLIDLIDRQHSVTLGADVTGDIYEGLLERNAQDTKSSAGQSVRAKVRVLVKRILRKYGYPPDKQEQATMTVLEHAELLCADLS